APPPRAGPDTGSDFRPVQGSKQLHNMGTVEVFHAGQWGSICDDQWDDSDAEVVCRQLGGVARAWGQAHFGKGSGNVWLDEVRCSGNELTLEQCPKSAWGEHNCLHSEDAGVSCSPLTGNSFLFVSKSDTLTDSDTQQTSHRIMWDDVPSSYNHLISIRCFLCRYFEFLGAGVTDSIIKYLNPTLRQTERN
uniref:SRCR domain-containing protein n=1 Tax=Nothobranchius furzeri TaxID=105023 RepID=A0A8C6K9E0_NOTFU